MLKIKAGLSVEVKLSSKRANVNELIIGAAQGHWTTALLAQLLNRHQLDVLDEYLGHRYECKSQYEFSCPYCSGRGLVRRGSRARQIKSSLGIIKFRLYQVSCRLCKTTFSPFMHKLGLIPRQRIACELELKLIDLAKDMSYKRSVDKVKTLLDVNVSTCAIYNVVKRRANRLDFDTHEDPPFMLLDSTKVKINDKIKGDDLNVVVGVVGRNTKDGRPYYDKRIMALNCGESFKELMPYLKDKTPQYVMCDGDHVIDNMINIMYPTRVRQWCLWHVPRSLYYRNMWVDKLAWKKRVRWIERLRHILQDYHADIRTSDARLDKYIGDLERMGLNDSATFLKTYRIHFWGYKTQIQKDLQEKFNSPRPLIASGVIERFIREIKRRSRVGVRFTGQGLSRLLKIKLIAEYNKNQYQSIWNFDLQEKKPILNVKITYC
jgi:transposase-like protein